MRISIAHEDKALKCSHKSTYFPQLQANAPLLFYTRNVFVNFSPIQTSTLKASSKFIKRTTVHSCRGKDQVQVNFLHFHCEKFFFALKLRRNFTFHSISISNAEKMGGGSKAENFIFVIRLSFLKDSSVPMGNFKHFFCLSVE